MLAVRLSLGRLLGVLALTLGAHLLLPAGAISYQWGPIAEPTGPEEIVFDWSTQACEPDNIPDLNADAFRDSASQVNLITAHFTNYRMIGPDFNSLQVDCAAPIMTSHDSSDPSTYDNKEWISSIYSPDGTTVRGLVHNEFHGWEWPGLCSTQGQFDPYCWYQSVTSASSTDGGRTWTHAPAPTHLVAVAPYQYVVDATPSGPLEPSLLKVGSYWYSMYSIVAYGAQQRGACIMRSNDLTNPKSWRAWDGTGYNVTYINPYTEPGPPEEHVCAPVALPSIDVMNGDLKKNTWLQRYLLMDVSSKKNAMGVKIIGIYVSTSRDLINWSPRKLLLEIETLHSWVCGDVEDPILYPAFIDHKSPSRNFDTTSQENYLYFTRFNVDDDCVIDLDRDLIRIPFRFKPTAVSF